MKMLDVDAVDFKRQKMIRDVKDAAVHVIEGLAFTGMMFGLCYVCCLG